MKKILAFIIMATSFITCSGMEPGWLWHPNYIFLQPWITEQQFFAMIPFHYTEQHFKQLLRPGCSIEYCQLIKLNNRAIHIQQVVTIENYNAKNESYHYFITPINLTRSYLTEGCSYLNKHWASNSHFLKAMKQELNGTPILVISITNGLLTDNFIKNEIFQDRTQYVQTEIQELKKMLSSIEQKNIKPISTSQAFYIQALFTY